MSPEERDRIRTLKRKYDEAMVAYDRFGERLPSSRLEEYHKFKEEYDKLSKEQLEEALKPPIDEQVKWCMDHLLELVSAYRIQLALQLQSDPENLWEALQPFIDTEIETFDASGELPFPVDLGSGLSVKANRAKTIPPKQILEDTHPTGIAQLILQLWNHVSDDEIASCVQRAKKLSLTPRRLVKYVDLSKAIIDYLNEISPEEKPKQRPQHDFLDKVASALSNRDSQADIPSLEDIYEEIEIWKLKSIEELGYHQMEILGRIEAFTRFAEYPEREINEGIKQGYTKWLSQYNRKQQKR